MNEIQLDLKGKPNQKNLIQKIKTLQEENKKLRNKIDKKEVWIVTARVIVPFMNGVECGDIHIQGIFSTKRRANLELNKLKNGKNSWFCYECLREKNSLIGLDSLYHTNFEANKCDYGHSLERIVYNDTMDFFEVHKHKIDESPMDYFY